MKDPWKEAQRLQAYLDWLNGKKAKPKVEPKPEPEDDANSVRCRICGGILGDWPFLRRDMGRSPDECYHLACLELEANEPEKVPRGGYF